MKTISTVRFRPKPDYFDLVADTLKKRLGDKEAAPFVTTF